MFPWAERPPATAWCDMTHDLLGIRLWDWKERWQLLELKQSFKPLSKCFSSFLLFKLEKIITSSSLVNYLKCCESIVDGWMAVFGNAVWNGLCCSAILWALGWRSIPRWSRWAGTGAAWASFVGAHFIFPEHLDQKETQIKPDPDKVWKKQVMRVSLMGLALNLLAQCVARSQFSFGLIYIENESL